MVVLKLPIFKTIQKQNKHIMLQSLQSVMEYQNKYVLHRFQQMTSLSKSEAETIFEDTKRYLWLNAKMAELRQSGNDVPDIYISKSMVILDEMWHAFVLNTRDYIAFCENYFGKFIHHPPESPKYFENLKKLGEEKTDEILLDEMIACVYDNLGEDVAVRWFDTYRKYSHLNVVH